MGNIHYSSGGGEIRTHDALSGIPVFKTGLFNRSSTPPRISGEGGIRTHEGILLPYLVSSEALSAAQPPLRFSHILSLKLR